METQSRNNTNNKPLIKCRVGPIVGRLYFNKKKSIYDISCSTIEDIRIGIEEKVFGYIGWHNVIYFYNVGLSIDYLCIYNV